MGCVLVACESDEAPPNAVGGVAGSSGAGGSADAVKMPAGPALTIAEGCQPLAPDASCLLPYPSDFFRVKDAAMPSGGKTVVTGAAKLVSGDGKNTDANIPGAWAPDGASLVPTIVAVLPDDVSASGLPALLDDPLKSSQITSPTLLIDTRTGALVAHYVDLDAKAKDPTRRAIAIRPFSRLDPRTRYVVALRGIKKPDGSLVPPAEAFRRLRSGEIGKDPKLAALHPRFEKEVLQAIDVLRVDRNELQLAWDFTTGSEEHAIADMVAIRDKTQAYLAEHPPVVSITSVTPGGESAWRIVKGTARGPLFLDVDKPGGRFVRDAQGAIAVTGESEIPFTMVVPKSVRDGFAPGHAVAFGHGFFGDQGELTGGAAKAILEATGSVGFAIDWHGLSSADLQVLADTLVIDPAEGANFVERVHQAMANWLTVSAAVAGPLGLDPALIRGGDGTSEGVVEDPAGGPNNQGATVYDPARLSFIGISMGHILGGVHAAVNPRVSRVVLNVGGAGFTHMMPRAVPFAPLFAIIASALREPLSTQSYLAMMAEGLDRIDPAVYAPFVLSRKLPDSVDDRQVLIQTGLGDSQVPNLGSFLHARALGIPLTSPSAAGVFGLGEVNPDNVKSAITVFDFGIDASDYAAGTLAPNKVHDSVRVDPQALAQMKTFLGEGKITSPCNGPCKGTLLP